MVQGIAMADAKAEYAKKYEAHVFSHGLRKEHTPYSRNRQNLLVPPKSVMRYLPWT